MAGMRIDGHQSGLRLCNAVAVSAGGRQSAFEGSFSRFLHIDIQGGLNPEPTGIDIVLANPVFQQFLYNVINEIRCYMPTGVALDISDRLGSSFLSLFRLDIPDILHTLQNNVATFARFIRVIHINGGGLNQTGNQGSFSQIQFVDVLAKVGAGSSLYTIGLFAKVDFVQVFFKDLIFGVVSFNNNCIDRFAGFSGNRLFIAQISLPDELLRNCTGTFLKTADF